MTAAKTGKRSPQDWIFLLAVLLGVLAIVLGGTSQRSDGYFGLVELAAIPLFCLSLYHVLIGDGWRTNRIPLLLAAATVAVPLLQLAPLPPALWTALPGREPSRLALELLGQAPGWRPMTLTPDLTRGALWSLLPPLAMLLAMMVLDASRRLQLAAVFVAGAAVSMVLGAAQLASGDDGLYLYDSVGTGSVVGFFTNRNHLATLILMAAPLAAAVSLMPLWRRLQLPHAGRWMVGAFLMLAIVALALTRSRTGIALALPVVLTSLLLIWSSRRSGPIGWPVLSLAALAGAAVATVAFFGLDPILARFEALSDSPELRFLYWPLVIEAAESFQPWGAGLGSFDPVFRSVEPLAHLAPRAFSRAHNDYLEIWLEAGAVGLVLVGLVLAWAGRAWLAAWSGDLNPASAMLARAAGVSILVVVLHSLVDYPARMEAIAVLLAFCLGALTPPPVTRRGRTFRE